MSEKPVTLLRDTLFLFIDETTMLDKCIMHSINTILNNIINIDIDMSGKIVIFCWGLAANA